MREMRVPGQRVEVGVKPQTGNIKFIQILILLSDIPRPNYVSCNLCSEARLLEVLYTLYFGL